MTAAYRLVDREQCLVIGLGSSSKAASAEYCGLSGDSRSAAREGFLLGLQEAVKVVNPRGVPQFAQRLGFDLPDALPRQVVQLANFLQRVAVPIQQAKAHFEDLPLALADTGHNRA